MLAPTLTNAELKESFTPESFRPSANLKIVDPYFIEYLNLLRPSSYPNVDKDAAVDIDSIDFDSRSSSKLRLVDDPSRCLNITSTDNAETALCIQNDSETFWFNDERIYTYYKSGFCLYVESPTDPSALNSFRGSNVLVVDCTNLSSINLPRTIWSMRPDQKISIAEDPSLCLDVDVSSDLDLLLNQSNVRLWDCEQDSTESFVYPRLTPPVSKIRLANFSQSMFKCRE